MRIACVALIVFGLSAFASGQISPEEAYQKLQEKQKARAAAEKAPHDSPAASQPAEADAPRPARGAGMTEARLLHQGWDAVAAHHYGQAVAIFDRAAAIDNADPNALMGRGICKYELKDYKAAGRDMEKAYRLADVGGPGHVSRQLVIAACAVDVMNDNPMRAVKLLRGLMEPMEQDNRLDEELQNDLGIALAHSNAQARKLPLYEEALKYYMEYDKKLNEQKKDGTARWGTQWISKEDAESKWKKYTSASDNAERASMNLDHVELALKQARDRYVDLHGLALHGTVEIQQVNDMYKQAILNEAGARRQYDKAMTRLEGVEKPPFPDRIEHDWSEPR
jgi:tetratricopeptide (TPR) repeat protein